MCVRIHISLDDDLVREIDRRAGRGNRSAFVASAVRQVLGDAERWELVWSGVGAIEEGGHEWDIDPASWVRAQREGDSARLG